MQNSIPTGCLQVDLLIKSYPQERERIVKYAIDERRRLLATYAELRGLISFHPVYTTKLVLLSGLVSFVLAFLLAQFAQLADWYKKLTGLKLTFAVPVVGEKVVDVGTHVPTSSTFEVGSMLPTWSIKECLWFTIAVMVVLLVMQAIQAAIRWRDAMRLKQGENELQQELTYLDPMTLNEYQVGATKTALYPDSGKNLLYPILGLCGESGELAEKMKKMIRDDAGILTDERRMLMKKELGDVLWYVSQVARELGCTLEEIGEENLAKLASRAERGVLHGNGDLR